MRVPSPLIRNSLFAVLLRSPWWISIAVAGGVFALASAMLPPTYAPYAGFIALPFLVIGCVAGWQQLREPSAGRVAATLESLRALSWDEFSGVLEDAYRHGGYGVTRLTISGADLELTRSGRVSLVACKRWKAARTGVEPLKELEALKHDREAHECTYIAAGEITGNAREYALGKNIRLLEGAEMAKLLRSAGRRKSA